MIFWFLVPLLVDAITINPARILSKTPEGDLSSETLSASNGIWVLFNALPSDTSSASLTISLPDDAQITEPLAVFWEEETQWPTTIPVPKTETARALAQISFNATKLTSSADLGVVAVLRRAFTLRIELSPNAFVTDMLIESISLSTNTGGTDLTLLMSRCNGATTCESCAARGELCGFCDGTCRFGWRDGPIGSSVCAATWQYDACGPSLLPIEECNYGLSYRYKFNVNSIPLSASSLLTVSSVASPFDNLNGTYAINSIKYQRNVRGIDVNSSVCDIDFTGETYSVGTLAFNQAFRGDVSDAVRSFVRAGERYLIVDVAAEFYNGEQMKFPLVSSSDRSRVRNAPRIVYTLAANGTPAPPPMCENATTCDTCTALPHCGWCGTAGRCVSGSRLAPDAACAAYTFVSCIASAKIVIPAINNSSCLAVPLNRATAPTVDGGPHAELSPDGLSLMLTFDLRPLREALSSIGNGGARRIVSGAVRLRTRWFSSVPSDVFANAVWLVNDPGSPVVCSANGTNRQTAVVLPRLPLLFGANFTVQPLALPVSMVPVNRDTLASALYSDTLQLRITLNSTARIWSPTAANDNERLAPVLVVDITRLGVLPPDPCAALSRPSCFGSLGCGWCSSVLSKNGASACVVGSPYTPFDVSDCLAANYLYAEPVVNAGITIQTQIVDSIDASAELWQNMPSLDLSAVEVLVTVPSTIVSRNISSATLSFSFVRDLIEDGSVHYQAEVAAFTARNNSVLATTRALRSTPFDSPLSVTLASTGFVIDVTHAVRTAAEAVIGARQVVVRVSANTALPSLDVRIHSSSNSYSRRAAALAVVAVPDARDVANAECVVHTNCTACSAVESCGWCVSDTLTGAGSCVPGSVQRALFDKQCAAWSYSACLTTGMIALYTPLACGNNGQTIVDGGSIDSLYVTPVDSPQSAILPRSQLRLYSHSVVTIDLTALRIGGRGAVSLQSPIRLRLFAAQPLAGADFSNFPAPTMLAWTLPSSGTANISVSDCTAISALAADEKRAIARTPIVRALNTGDAIDLDVSAAFANVSTTDYFVRIAFGIATMSPLEVVAPGNCARSRFRPMLVARTPQLTRSSVGQRRVIVDDCAVDGGLYSDATTISETPQGRRDIVVGAAQQWRAGELSASAAQNVSDIADALRDTLPRIVDITSLAFVAPNATLVAFVGTPAIGRFDLVRLSDSLNVSTASPIRVVLVVDADVTPTGNATVELVRGASLRGTVPTVVVEAKLVGLYADCLSVSATGQVSANGTMSVRTVVERFPRAQLNSMQRFVLKDVGGESIVLQGVGFVSPTPDPRVNGPATCHFADEVSGDGFVTNATIHNNTVVTCGSTLPIDVLVVRGGVISLSWDGGFCKTATVAAFDVVSDCNNRCSGHGVCRLQECVCDDPFRGANCERMAFPPIVMTVPNATIDDGQSYSVQIKITNGTAPFSAVLFGLPDGAIWNATSLTLTWPRAVGRMRPYELSARIGNELTTVPVTWFLTVRRTINVKVTADQSRTPLPVGEVADLRVQVTPVTSGVVASIETSVQGNAWYEIGSGEYGAVVPFRPTASHVGSNVFVATRPGDDPSDAIDRLTIEVIHLEFGAPSVPSIALVAGEKRTIQNVVTLFNPSKRALSNIVVVIYAQHANATEPVIDIPSLAAGENRTISVELTVANNASVTSDNVVFAARSVERASAVLSLPATIVTRRGSLVLVDNRALKASVPFDEPRFLTFAVRNAAPIVARDVTVELGNASSIFAVVSGRFTSDLAVNATLTVTLRVLVASPPTTTRVLVGSIAVRADEGAYLSVPFEITATSSATGTLVVIPEDQGTYYGGGVLVPGASARLFDVNGNLVRSFGAMPSSIMSELLAENVTEGRYELRVEAPGRAPARELIYVQRGIVNRVTVFLARTLVSYVWRVVPTGVNDEYTFVLDFTFETNVPAPVLSIEPNTLKVERWCDQAVLAASLNDTFVVNFNLTNQGLIRAEKVRFEFPTTNALVTFEKLLDVPATIEAHQTAIVPVAVRARPGLLSCKFPTPTATRKRQEFSGCEVALVTWSIECAGEKVTVESLGIEIDGLLPCPGRAGPLPKVPGGSGGGDITRSIGDDSGGGAGLCKLDKDEPPEEECKDLLKDAALDCGAAIVPPIAWAKAAKELYSWIEDHDVVSAAESGIEAIESAGEQASPLARVFECLKSLFETRKCTKEDLKKILHMIPHRKRAVDEQLRLTVEADMVAYLAEMELLQRGIDTLIGGGGNFFVVAMLGGRTGGDAVWLRSLVSALKLVPLPVAAGQNLELTLSSMFGASKLAQLRGSNYTVTRQAVLERLSMLVAFPNATVLPTGFNVQNRINLTELTSTANSAIAAFDFAQEAGHTSPFAGFTARRSELIAIEARRNEGVCAVVKVRIEQRVSLTRTVFEASLTIDNTADDVLSRVAVGLTILDAQKQPVALTVFNVTRRAAPLLDSPNATLAVGAQAELVWMVAPQDAAAMRDPTVYYAGGTLRYRIGAEPESSIEMMPERIVVHPNPRLRFDYFLERRVLSDDPFTDDIVEPSVPFSLGLIVSNDGYGVAENMSATSSQPKIVDNKKGLLVDFAILSVRANDKPVSPSLQVALGDISALSSATAVWSLTATLQGEFTEFNASFVHQSPASDSPQLTSLVHAVNTHRLTRAVTLPTTNRVAFLADDTLDIDSMPDTLYSGRTPEPVARLLITSESAVAPLFDSATKTLTLTSFAPQISTQNARYYYVRMADPFNASSSVAVVGAESVPGNVSAIDAWREQYTERLVNQEPRAIRWLHLFANTSDGFVWRLRTVTLPTALQVLVVNVTATSGVAQWNNATSPVDIEYHRVPGNVTVLAAAAWSGPARFAVGDLVPDTDYDLIVTPVSGSVRGSPATARFHTISIDAGRRQCAAAGTDPMVCNATIGTLVTPITCTNTTTCENGGALDATCKCACVNRFTGARCQTCETASLQCANGIAAALDGKCACSCATGWSGARCDEIAVGLDNCAAASLSSTMQAKVDVKLCFDFPRPSSAKLIGATSARDDAVFAFNSSVEFPNVIATVSVRRLSQANVYSLVVYNGSAFVDAASTCSPRSALTSANGSLTVGVCSLGPFVVVKTGTVAPATAITSAGGSTTAESTSGSSTDSAGDTTTSIMMSNASTTTLMIPLMTNATEPSSSKAGLIGGLVAAAIILLCCGGGIAAFIYYRRKKEKDEEKEEYAGELHQTKTSAAHDKAVPAADDESDSRMTDSNSTNS